MGEGVSRRGPLSGWNLLAYSRLTRELDESVKEDLEPPLLMRKVVKGSERAQQIERSSACNDMSSRRPIMCDTLRYTSVMPTAAPSPSFHILDELVT